MKKVNLFFAALVAVVMNLCFSSCRGGEADNVLTGTWVWQLLPEASGINYKDILTFDDKETFTLEECVLYNNVQSSSHLITGTYAVEEDILTLRYRYNAYSDEREDKYKYEIKNKSLYLHCISSPQDDRTYTKQ